MKDAQCAHLLIEADGISWLENVEHQPPARPLIRSVDYTAEVKRATLFLVGKKGVEVGLAVPGGNLTTAIVAMRDYAIVEPDGAPLDADDRPWFLTLTGRKFFYDAPEDYDFELGEIAHALSHLCRFAGHLPHFYSVAEHSVHVMNAIRHVRGWHHGTIARGLSEDIHSLLRAALLHDASEAFLMDLPRPLKRMPGLLGYRTIEARVQAAIYQRWGLWPWSAHEDIERADRAVLRREKDQLRGASGYQSNDRAIEAANVTIKCLAPKEARELFLATWRELDT